MQPEHAHAASAELLAARMLQVRMDTKFILKASALDALLGTLYDDYAVVVSGSQTNARYDNLYFDTPAHLALTSHHRGVRPRFKVRIRHHLDRQMSFLEVKEKRNTNRTHKQRMAIPFMTEDLDAAAIQFIQHHCPIDPSTLQKSMRIRFSRMTLVGRHSQERITVDSHLQFSAGEAHADLPGTVITEVKQERYRPTTTVMRALRAAKAHQMSLSKYCTAAQLLLPHIKMNRYRPRLRMLRRHAHA